MFYLCRNLPYIIVNIRVPYVVHKLQVTIYGAWQVMILARDYIWRVVAWMTIYILCFFVIKHIIMIVILFLWLRWYAAILWIHWCCCCCGSRGGGGREGKSIYLWSDALPWTRWDITAEHQCWATHSLHYC